MENPSRLDVELAITRFWKLNPEFQDTTSNVGLAIVRMPRSAYNAVPATNQSHALTVA